jgi:hypothetical protein
MQKIRDQLVKEQNVEREETQGQAGGMVSFSVTRNMFRLTCILIEPAGYSRQTAVCEKNVRRVSTKCRKCKPPQFLPKYMQLTIQTLSRSVATVKSFDLEKANCAKRLETLEQRVRSLEEENGHLKKREHEVNESLVLERVSSAELQEKILSCELIVKGLQDENQALKADQVEDEKEIQEYVDLTMELTKRLKARNR